MVLSVAITMAKLKTLTGQPTEFEGQCGNVFPKLECSGEKGEEKHETVVHTSPQVLPGVAAPGTAFPPSPCLHEDTPIPEQLLSVQSETGAIFPDDSDYSSSSSTSEEGKKKKKKKVYEISIIWTLPRPSYVGPYGLKPKLFPKNKKGGRKPEFLYSWHEGGHGAPLITIAFALSRTAAPERTCHRILKYLGLEPTSCFKTVPSVEHAMHDAGENGFSWVCPFGPEWTTLYKKYKVESTESAAESKITLSQLRSMIKNKCQPPYKFSIFYKHLSKDEHEQLHKAFKLTKRSVIKDIIAQMNYEENQALPSSIYDFHITSHHVVRGDSTCPEDIKLWVSVVEHK